MVVRLLNRNFENETTQIKTKDDMINSLLAVTTVLNDSIDAISQIGKNTYDTAENTKFGIIAGITFVLSIATFIVSILTYISQRATQRNTARISQKGQLWIILDKVRYLYKNLIDLFAIRNLLEKCDFNAYPSEIHMESMKIEMEDIKQNVFLDLDEHSFYYVLKTLEDFKRYNISLGILNTHLRDKRMVSTAKQESLRSLMNETVRLMTCIEQIIYYIDYKKHTKDNFDEFTAFCTKGMDKKIIDCIKREATEYNDKDGRVIEKYKLPINERDFMELIKAYFHFVDKNDLERLNQLFFNNVRLEMGKDFNNTPMIHMIMY